MPLIGRYYKSANEAVTSGFVYTIAYHASTIYNRMKTIISEMIGSPKQYLKSKED